MKYQDALNKLGRKSRVVSVGGIIRATTPPVVFGVDDKYRTMQYSELRERLTALIPDMDEERREKAQAALARAEQEQQSPQCKPCGSNATRWLRLWLSKYDKE